MSLRIRGQEVTVRISVDGDTKGGTFAKVENFKLTERAETPESDFLGETESETDFIHHGWDFSFNVHEMDSKVFDLVQSLISKHVAGLPLPTVHVVAVYKYRDPALPSRAVVLENCKIKLDDHDVSGRKDYVKNSFSGKCKKVSALPT